MALTKLNLNSESNLEFEVKIEGADDSNADVRFVIESSDYSMSFRGTRTQDGYSFKIPALKGKMNPGLHECQLQVNIGEFFFKPVIDKIEIEQPVVIESTMKPVTEAAPVVVKADLSGSETLVRLTSLEKFKSLCEELDYTIIQNSDGIIAMHGMRALGAFDFKDQRGQITKIK